jgi:protein-tyrosine phosphatase
MNDCRKARRIRTVLSVTDFDRRIPFEQVFNFRDLGGYAGVGGATVRWRRLFRADGLNRLQPEEEAFAKLGIATVVDLRTVEEVGHGGRFPTHVWDVAYHHRPMFDVLPDWPADIGDPALYLAERYMEMFTAGQASIAAVFGLLAVEDSYPLVFHCAAGKDRTGIMAALALHTLGVDDETIAADYALSHEAMERLMVWAREQQGVFMTPRAPVPSAVVQARPATMIAFLRAMRDRTGGGDGLLTSVGLDPSVGERMRGLLLERA